MRIKVIFKEGIATKELYFEGAKKVEEKDGKLIIVYNKYLSEELGAKWTAEIELKNIERIEWRS